MRNVSVWIQYKESQRCLVRSSRLKMETRVVVFTTSPFLGVALSFVGGQWPRSPLISVERFVRSSLKIMGVPERAERAAELL